MPASIREEEGVSQIGGGAEMCDSNYPVRETTSLDPYLIAQMLLDG